MPARDSMGRFIKGAGGGGVSVSVTSKDNGYDALIARLSKAAKERILTVGIHEEEGANGDGTATVAEVGSFHEFGLGVPQRSFIGAWADSTEAEKRGDLKKMGEALVKGALQDPVQGFNQLGEKYVGEVQSRMASGIPPESKVDGRVITLIDTGVLRSSITKRVV